jgi:hypothetical protein
MSFVQCRARADNQPQLQEKCRFERGPAGILQACEKRIMEGVNMNIKFDRAGVKLEADRFLRLEQCQGTRIECRSGSLWVTQDHDARDYIVGPGEALELEHGGDAIVFALLQSELVLNEPAPAATLLDRLGRAIVDSLDGFNKWIAGHFGPSTAGRRSIRGWHAAI